jgi:hypothetical protein
MTKTFATAVSLALIVTVAVSQVWAVGGKVRSDNAQGEAGEIGNGTVQASRGNPVGESIQILTVQEDVTGKKAQSGTAVPHFYTSASHITCEFKDGRQFNDRMEPTSQHRFAAFGGH